MGSINKLFFGDQIDELLKSRWTLHCHFLRFTLSTLNSLLVWIAHKLPYCLLFYLKFQDSFVVFRVFFFFFIYFGCFHVLDFFPLLSLCCSFNSLQLFFFWASLCCILGLLSFFCCILLSALAKYNMQIMAELENFLELENFFKKSQAKYIFIFRYP